MFQDYDDASDESLIASALKGDKKSLNQLLKKHQDYIFNIALKMLNSVPNAEDVTQEILIKIVTNLSNYNASKASFRTYIYRITFNHILNVKKSPIENQEVTFDTFFNFIESVPSIELTDEEVTFMGENIDEARVSCTAGMLMCLSREQRLIYIIGDIFKINHNLASEIFQTTPSNFRKKLSRSRADLHQWMHKKCGLINKENPCRCKSKTKKFIELGLVSKESPKWHSNYKKKVYELTEDKLENLAIATDELYTKIHANTPFKSSLKAKEIYDEILNRKDFSEFMNIDKSKLN